MKEGMAAYKVVNESRQSVIVEAKEFRLRYPVGEIVFAIKGSIGIMCFDDLDAATDLAGKHSSNEVIEVIGYNKRIFSFMMPWQDTFSGINMTNWYQDDKFRYGVSLLYNTVLFDSVKVLT